MLSSVSSKLRIEKRAQAVPVLQAFGRVTAQDVVSPRDVPPYPTSHMDGFAFIADDVASASQVRPSVLRVVGSAGPGQRPRAALKPGEAFRVATGALLPARADTVVPMEDVVVGQDEISFTSPAMRGSFVFEVGNDVKKGQRLLSSGRPVRAQDISLLLGLGVTRVAVWRKPKVGVLATGSELTASSAPASGKVRESHRPMFLRLCEAAGCDPVDLGIVTDDPRALARSLGRGLAACDFVVTLGGTSAGGRDLVVGTVSGMRPETMFHGIKLDRGRVSGIASVKGRPVLMLPGPIQAAANAFFIMGYPILERLSGRTGLVAEVHCRLGRDWEARKRFADFTKVVYVKLHTDEAIAEPLSGETESLKLLADADGYFVVPEEVSRLEKGSRVTVKLIPGFSHA